MNTLDSNDLKNLKNYKYISEDYSYLTKIYSKVWNFSQSYIPRSIHPNIITLIGIFTVIYGYTLNSNNYSNIIMSICLLLYMSFDSIDGIHARKTKQTTIIGEYFDHLGDLVVLGFGTTYLFDMLGFESNLFMKNIILLFCSVNFIRYHWDAIITKKIVFTGFSDTSLILTSLSLLVLVNLKLQ